MVNFEHPPQKVVVLGGGIGGINAIRQLGQLKNISVTLIDPKLFHICKPALHEVAAGALTSQDNRFSFSELAREFKFNFIQALPEAHDSEKRKIRLSTGDIISYDWLIVACGAVPNDFQTEGVQQHCLFLNNLADANEIHKKVQAGVTSAYPKKEPFQAIIIGGGPTGVQLAAELHEAFAKKRLPNGKSPLALTLVEGLPHLLSSFAENIRNGVVRRLSHLSVDIKLQSIVSRISDQGIFLKDGTFIPADLIVWTAGVKPNPVLKNLFPDLEYGRNGGLLVTNTLQTTRDPHILAVGDCAFIADNPLPPTAQAARQKGIYLTKIGLPALLAGKKPEPFLFNHQGAIVILAKYAAWGEFSSGKSYGGRGLGNCFAQFLHNLLFIRQQYELGGFSFALKKLLRRKFS